MFDIPAVNCHLQRCSGGPSLWDKQCLVSVVQSSAPLLLCAGSVRSSSADLCICVQKTSTATRTMNKWFSVKDRPERRAFSISFTKDWSVFHMLCAEFTGMMADISTDFLCLLTYICDGIELLKCLSRLQINAAVKNNFALWINRRQNQKRIKSHEWQRDFALGEECCAIFV